MKLSAIYHIVYLYVPIMIPHYLANRNNPAIICNVSINCQDGSKGGTDFKPTIFTVALINEHMQVTDLRLYHCSHTRQS